MNVLAALQMERLWPAGVVAGLLTLGISLPAVGQGEGEADDELVFVVTGLKDARGQVRCSVYRESGWLKTPVVEVSAKIVGGKASCRFQSVKPGTYGLAAYHDEDGDDELDTNIVGIPSEGLCASRNATGTLGPPSFDDAQISYTGGTKTLTAKVVY